MVNRRYHQGAVPAVGNSLRGGGGSDDRTDRPARERGDGRPAEKVVEQCGRLIPNRACGALVPALACRASLAGGRHHVTLYRLQDVGDGDVLRRTGQAEPALSAAQVQLHERVLKSVKSAGLGGVARGNLASESNASGPDMKLILRLLAEEGEIVTAGVYVIAREGLDEARGRLLELFGKGPRVKLNDFRMATGLARNAAVAILERFDSEGMTRRDGDARILLRSGGAS